MVKLCTGNMHPWENLILSQRAGKAHYLCSEIAKYISAAEKKFKGKQYRKQKKRSESRIAYLVNWFTSDMREMSNKVNKTRRVGNQGKFNTTAVGIYIGHVGRGFKVAY